MKYLQMLLATVLCMFFAAGPTTTYAFSEGQIVRDTRGQVSIDTARKIVAYVKHFSTLYSVDPTDVFRIMKKESSFKPRAISSHGAIGLMQVIPSWHRDKLMGRDPYDIATNIEVGIRIWAEYLKAGGSKMAALTKYSGGSKKYAIAVMRIRSAKGHPQVDMQTTSIRRTASVVYAEAIMKYNSPLPSQVYEEVIGVAIQELKEAPSQTPGDSTTLSTCMGDEECTIHSKIDYG